MLRHHLSLALFVCAACVVEESDDEFRIINGDPASDSVAQYRATVGLHFKVAGPYFSSTPGCSGTLIAPDVVMTAGHCYAKATDVRVYFGEGVGDPDGVLVAVSESLRHPSYNNFSLANDITLLRLAAPAPAGVTPVPHLPGNLAFDSGDVGTTLDFVGFGYSDLAKTDFGAKLHNTLPLGAMGCPQSVYPGCPANAPTTTQFSYSQSDGNQVEGPCNGDSGGPAFVNLGGTVYAAGITSYGDVACDDYGVSTHVAAFDAWIDAFIGTGGGGGGPACGDGTCSAGESCDGRNGTSSCITDCPGKSNGKPAARWCTVGGACEGPGCP